MKVYKPKYKDDRPGREAKTCQHWYLMFRDNLQVRRRLPCFQNQRATARAGEKIEELLSCGGILSQDLQRWVEKEIPETMRQRLVDWGLIDRQRVSAHLGKTLFEHLEDFAASLEAKGNGPGYVEAVKSCLTFIFTQCGFKAWGDIDANRLYTGLADLRGEDGIGERTFNFYLKAAKQFCRWLVRERRATASPLEHLSCMEQTEKRRQRRALTLDEQRKLLAVTASGPAHHNMTGPERAWLYRIALETGLRANEIRQLIVSAFDFAACTVTVPAAYTKNRKVAVLDLKRETAAELEAFLLLSGKMPLAGAFAMPDQPVKMLKRDLEAAGIPYATEEGQADFHGLRHTFITNLAKAGVHPSDAMALARHSTITLTMNCYTHTVRDSLRKIVNAQPDLMVARKGAVSA